jgi:hypothetical protein
MIVLKLRGARERAREKGRCEGAKPNATLESESAVLDRMKALQAEGMHLAGIAGRPNQDGIKPRRGTQWYPMTVGRILERAA